MFLCRMSCVKSSILLVHIGYSFHRVKSGCLLIAQCFHLSPYNAVFSSHFGKSSFPFECELNFRSVFEDLNLAQQPHRICCMILSSGLRDLKHSGRNFQSRSFLGRMLGFLVWRTLMMTMSKARVQIGTSTHNSTVVPARERPNTAVGNTKKRKRRYMMANHRYFAVWLPRNLAI